MELSEKDQVKICKLDGKHQHQLLYRLTVTDSNIRRSILLNNVRTVMSANLRLNTPLGSAAVTIFILIIRRLCSYYMRGYFESQLKRARTIEALEIV